MKKRILFISLFSITVLLLLYTLILYENNQFFRSNTEKAAYRTLELGDSGIDVIKADFCIGDSFSLEQYKSEIKRFAISGMKSDAVLCAQDAVDVAERHWREVFHYDVSEKRPYIVSFDACNDTWLVKGTLQPLRFGGVPYILINSSGEVIAIWHTK